MVMEKNTVTEQWSCDFDFTTDVSDLITCTPSSISLFLTATKYDVPALVILGESSPDPTQASSGDTSLPL